MHFDLVYPPAPPAMVPKQFFPGKPVVLQIGSAIYSWQTASPADNLDFIKLWLLERMGQHFFRWAISREA